MHFGSLWERNWTKGEHNKFTNSSTDSEQTKPTVGLKTSEVFCLSLHFDLISYLMSHVKLGSKQYHTTYV